MSARIHLAREGRIRTFLPLTLVIFCLATLISPENARGDVILSARSSANLASGTDTQTGSAGTVSSAKAGTLGTDLTETRSSATFGQLRGYAAISDGTAGTTGGTFATSTSFFRDDFLFNADGKAGTAGTVEMKFKIDGTLSASSTLIAGFGAEDSVFSLASYRFYSGNGNYDEKTEWMRTERWGIINGANPHYGSLFLGLEQTYIVPFTFGTTLQGVGLQLQVMAAGFGNGDFTSSSIADLEHTANWGGFGDVRDSNGNIISNYTFSSGSGFNYTLGITGFAEAETAG